MGAAVNIDILSGVYATATDYRVAYPRNMMPVVQPNGISAGYLRPTEGMVLWSEVGGVSRGGIEWMGVLYRVMGNYLYRIAASGGATLIGGVGPGAHVAMDYSFDYLCIVSGGRAYLYNGIVLAQITDLSLGYVLDVVWIDGFFMFTDGTSLFVTKLTDPFSINPLSYGSSEADPDPIVGLLELREEVYAINTQTIEVFDNVGGSNVFPFQRNQGALITRGAAGTHCAVVFLEAITFLGGGRNEAPAVWLALNGSTSQISTREIDLILKNYTQAQLALSVVEVRVEDNLQLLYIHLPDLTLVYDGTGSASLKKPIWFVVDSGVLTNSQYRAQDFVWTGGKWTCADPTASGYGYLTSANSYQYGDAIGWEISTAIAYNESRGAIFHELELVALSGGVEFGADPVIWTSYSVDGKTWSQERPIKCGKSGQTEKRITWFQQGSMRDQRIQKFRGTSDAHLPITKLEGRLEALRA